MRVHSTLDYNVRNVPSLYPEQFLESVLNLFNRPISMYEYGNANCRFTKYGKCILVDEHAKSYMVKSAVD